MIVRSVQDGWRIVFHSAHALLAHRLATFLKFPDLPFWFETCAAIGMHDDQKLPFQQGATQYLTAAGAPLDFMLLSISDESRLIEARRQIGEARRKHQWIGSLVSMHADFLYRAQTNDPEMSDFLNTECKRRECVLEELSIREEVLRKSYQLLRWCDRCSLILCGADVPAMRRRLEITELPGLGRVDIWEAADGVNHVQPWPFEDDQISLDFEQRLVRQLKFKDDAELWDALMEIKPDRREVLLRTEP